MILNIKIKKKNKIEANHIHYEVGSKVRKEIKDIDGLLIILIKYKIRTLNMHMKINKEKIIKKQSDLVEK